MSDPNSVLDFWFYEIEPAQWWRKDPAFDAQLEQRFGQLHDDVTRTGALHWRAHATGRLAEVIVLDQFSRNLYRDDPRAFAWDAAALTLAEETIALALDVALIDTDKWEPPRAPFPTPELLEAEVPADTLPYGDEHE